MARRIWIVSEDTEIDEGVLADAAANNCPEIAQGIPPSLKDTLSEDMLPCAYEYPEPPLPDIEINNYEAVKKIRVKRLLDKGLIIEAIKLNGGL